MLDEDASLRAEVKAHINRFPRMESHIYKYCRSESSCQYLSADLNINTMHSLYKLEHPEGASRDLYGRVFNSMKLKFHTPKKDQCGLCGNYRESTEEEKKALRSI